jgi:hypothetical protein
MKREIYLSIFLAVIISLISACGGNAPSNSNSTSNANSNASNAGHGQITTSQHNEETFNNAPTLGPVVQQYYDALKTKDDAKLRETLTAPFLKNIEDDMKAANRKDLAAYVAETDYREGQTIEVRNEKIEGDKGVAEVKGGAYKNWTAFSFAKENGKWKFTGGSPEIDNVPPANVNGTSPH